VLAIAAVAVFVVFLDTTALYVAYPDIRQSFAGVSPAQLSWVLNAYTIAFAALLIPAGRLADRLGRKRVFLTGSALFAVASAVCGLAPNASVLVGARALQAIGAAALTPASLAVVLHAFPRQRLPVAVAIWGAVGALAAAAGPTLGAAMVEWFGWRAVFYLNLPITVIALTVGSRVVAESREADAGPVPDVVSVVALAAGVAALSLGVVQGDEWGWTSAAVLGSFAVAAVVLAFFLRRCATVAAPLIEPALFRTRNVRVANLATFVFGIGFTASFFGNIQFLTGVWHYSVLRAGFAIVPGPLVVAVLAPFAGRVAGRRGQAALLVPGGLCYAAASAWYVLSVDDSPNYWATWFPGTIVGGVGVAMCLPQLASAAVQGLPGDRLAAGSGVNQALRQIGSTIGVAAAVAITGTAVAGDLLGRYRGVWWLIVASGLGVSLIATQLRRTPSTDPAPAAAVVADAVA
jgi:EmrB/QacA subfamily drug resistance transporter